MATRKRAVSRRTAATESFGRTVVQSAIAAIIVWVTANGVDGLNNLSWWQAVAMAGLSGAAAAVMRIFAPIVTDFRDRYVDAPKTAGTTPPANPGGVL